MINPAPSEYRHAVFHTAFHCKQSYSHWKDYTETKGHITSSENDRKSTSLSAEARQFVAWQRFDLEYCIRHPIVFKHWQLTENQYFWFMLSLFSLWVSNSAPVAKLESIEEIKGNQE